MKYWLRSMHANLMAEVCSPEVFAEVATGWLTGFVTEVVPALYADLVARPVTGRVVLSGRGPMGAPGQVRGMLIIARDTPVDWRRSLWSERSWPRFLAKPGEYPVGAHVEITPLDDQGYPLHRHDGEAYASVSRDTTLEPGWVSCAFTVPAADTDWPDSPQVQEAWAGFVRGQAARVAGACAGSMTDDIRPGQSSLERSLQASCWAHSRGSGLRDHLRGYWWVTVVPGSLLTGSEAVAATGAFHEVCPLPDGSLWLRATPVINEFTGDRIRMVFEALAPVLLTGTTESDYGEEYRILEGVDAADYC